MFWLDVPAWLPGLLWRLFKLAFCTGIYILVWNLYSADGLWTQLIMLVGLSPIWGVAFAQDLIRLPGSFKRHAEETATREWHGCHFSFDERHLRFYQREQEIWLPVADLDWLTPPLQERELRLLGGNCKRIATANSMCVNEPGLLKLLQVRTGTRHATRQMIRFRQWLVREAFPNLKQR